MIKHIVLSFPKRHIFSAQMFAFRMSECLKMKKNEDEETLIGRHLVQEEFGRGDGQQACQVVDALQAHEHAAQVQSGRDCRLVERRHRTARRSLRLRGGENPHSSPLHEH